MIVMFIVHGENSQLIIVFKSVLDAAVVVEGPCTYRDVLYLW